MKVFYSTLIAVILTAIGDFGIAQSSVVSRSASSLFFFSSQKLISTPDGGFLVLRGEKAEPISPQTVALVKYDAQMVVQWSRIYLGENRLRARGLVLTSDGNYLAGVSAEPLNSATRHSKVFKVDPSGNLLWSRDYGFQEPNDTSVQVVQMVPNDQGGVLLAAVVTRSQNSGTSDCMLLETDGTGNVLWSKVHRVGLGSNEEACSPRGMVVDEERNIYLAGVTSNINPLLGNFWLAKFDSSGTNVWSNIWVEGRINSVESLGLLNDSTLVLQGNIELANDPTVAPVLMTIDTGGNQVLNQVYMPNPIMDYNDVFNMAVATNKIYLVGRAPSPGIPNNYLGFFYLEMNHQLDTLLTQVYAGNDVTNSSGNDLVMTANGPVLMGGIQTNGGLFSTLTALGPNPRMACDAVFSPFSLDTTRNQARFPLPLEVYQRDSAWVAPFRDSVANFSAINVCTIVGVDARLDPEIGENKIFPNPSNGDMRFQKPLSKGRVQVIGMNGKVLKERLVKEGTRNLIFSDLVAGVYVFRFIGAEGEWRSKLMIQ